MNGPLVPALLRPLVTRALAEDLEGGDLTTEATVDPSTQAMARAVARGELPTVAGHKTMHVKRGASLPARKGRSKRLAPRNATPDCWSDFLREIARSKNGS